MPGHSIYIRTVSPKLSGKNEKTNAPNFFAFSNCFGYVWLPRKKSRFFPRSMESLKTDTETSLDFLCGDHTYPYQIENTIKLGGIVVSTSKLGQIVRQRCEPFLLFHTFGTFDSLLAGLGKKLSVRYMSLRPGQFRLR